MTWHLDPMFMSYIGPVLTSLLTIYALITGVFLILENRRPQSTLAWMLVFISLPGFGVLIYVLFGRGRKAFSKQSELLRQDLRASALPLLSPILCRQDAEIARLELESASRRKLMMLVRRCRRRKGLERGGRVAPAQLPHGGPSAPRPARVAQGGGRVGP